MDNQTTQQSPTDINPLVLPTPPWWSEKHNSAWDHAKQALRRDWEQTKADFTANSGVQLNQTAADTVMQATGTAAVPMLLTKTRPDEPRDVTKRLVKDLKARGHGEGMSAAARTDEAIEQVKADGKIAQEKYEEREKVLREEGKLDEIALSTHESIQKDEREGVARLARQREKIADVREKAGGKIAKQRDKIVAAHTSMIDTQKKARETIEAGLREDSLLIAQEQDMLVEIAAGTREAVANDAQKGLEQLAKQQVKITELREKAGETIAHLQDEEAQLRNREWIRIEPAMRYGYGARMEYADGQQWAEDVEQRLQTGWAEMKTDSTWDDARAHVRHGWDSIS